MPTIYQTREHIIERVGPGQGGMSGSGAVIAICDHKNTAQLLVDALMAIKHLDDIDDCTAEMTALLLRAGLI